MPRQWLLRMARCGSLKTSMGRMRSSPNFWRRDILIRLSGVKILPAPDAAQVHVNEVGRRIVTDTAALKRQGGVPKSRRFHTRQANVDGLCLHVQALLSNAGSVGAQILVRLRRAIAANDLYLTVWAAAGLGQIEQHVE